MMWRTSWMSREVIVLPAFIGVVGLWWLAALAAASPPVQRGLALAALALAVVLWYCTAMIYACLRFIQEWAHPLTIVNYTLIGLSSVVGGMMYPVSVLPTWLQYVSRLVPVTYAMEGMRAALLGHATLRELWPSLAALLIFAAVLLPVSFTVFSWALRRTKITGTLTHF